MRISIVLRRLAASAFLTIAALQAGPLTPPLIVPPVVAGESTLCHDGVGCTGAFAKVTVDWIVTYTASDSTYNYYYQAESANDLFFTHFEVFTPFSPFFAIGFLADTNLDTDFIGVGGEAVLGHTLANYANLGPVPPPAESELVGSAINPDSFVLDPGFASWLFSPGMLFRQSSVLWGRSLLPPVYGNALGVGFNRPDTLTWSSLEPGSDQVPIPGGATSTPEPSTVIEGMALAILAFAARRRSIWSLRRQRMPIP